MRGMRNIKRTMVERMCDDEDELEIIEVDDSDLPIDTTWWRCVGCNINFFSDDTSECPECGSYSDKMGTLEDYYRDNKNKESE